MPVPNVPTLSIIVPVYGVEEYLAECLDSILAYRGAEIEVVAVNDASPDGCAAILADYAARDSRVRVVTLADNVGLGLARNAGFDRAAGRYVWTVDSDDWLTEGAVAAVLARLAEVAPDVLIVGFERSFWDGRLRREAPVPAGPELPGGASSLPAVFTMREHPVVVTGLHVAWNKIVRRELLPELGVRFQPGWYEDVSFSHPVLLAARRISVLDRVCYGYRQRPGGTITSTRTQRHFEVFEQWHQVFTFLDRHPECDDLRGPIFRRMMWHYIGVLNAEDRVLPERRRAFFADMVRDCQTLYPAGGYPPPPGLARLKFALVAHNAFRLFEALRTIYRTRHVVARPFRFVQRMLRRGYYRAHRLLPLRSTVAVYATASHRGFPHAPHAYPIKSTVDDALALANGARGGSVVLIAGDGVVGDGVGWTGYEVTTPPGAATPFQVVTPAAAQLAVGTGVSLHSRAALRALARARMIVSDAPLPAHIVPRRGQLVAHVSGRRPPSASI